jgi:hypothetical protein
MQKWFKPWVLLLAVASVLVTVCPEEARGDELRSLLRSGWTYKEAGSLRQAEESFTAALETPAGRNSAEVYYAIAALWWERRNAMAAYMWLSDAEKASRDSYAWDSGPDGEWDHRIEARRRYIENNFTVIKLRAPKRGKPLAPLADPRPTDPLLAEFTETVSRVVEEGVEAKVSVQWVLLPNGTYWVGEELIMLDSGELEPSRAESWDLPKDGGAARRAYEERLAALERGESMAIALLTERDGMQRLDELEAQRAAEEEARLALEAEERQAREAAEREQRERDEADRLAREAREAEEREAEQAERQAREDEERRQRELEEDRSREAERAERQAREDEERRQRELEQERRAEEERLAREQDERREAELADLRRRDAERAEEERRRRDADDAERAARDAEERLAREEAERRREADEADRDAREAEERLARQIEERERREAEEADRLTREDDERLERERRDREWEEARERADEQQELDAQAEAERREELRDLRASGDLDRFRDRRMYLVAGVGGATVGRMGAEANTGEVAWTSGGELGYLVPVGDKGVGVGIGLSYANLPVSGCSRAQTRASTAALHVGPRVPVALGRRAWLTIRGGVHVGASGTWPSDDVRDACAQSRLEPGDDPGVLYGVRLTDGETSGRVSYAELGWRGYAVAFGPDLEVGALFGPGDAPLYLGAVAFVRHDQLFAVVRGGTYHFRDEGSASLQLGSASVSSVDGKVSMARFQFGVRAMVMF